MKLTAKAKLLTTIEQHAALLATLEQCNVACNWISEQAWVTKTWGQFRLHRLVYHETRRRFGLNSSLVVRCIAKVTDAYKLDKRTQRTFKLHGAIAFDHNILRWYAQTQRVSITSVAGRQHISFVCGAYHLRLLQTQQGESDLVLIKGTFYLLAPCNVEEVLEQEVEGVLGIDLGIVNLATDSDGKNYSGEALEKNRRIHAHRRRNLQHKGTKSAKRKLKILSGRQSRFQQDTNHTISKRIVAKAKDTNRAIAAENLTGIRSRTTARKQQRARLANWSFFQLKQYLAYKAKLVGVMLFEVDPRNTSRTCPVCGCIDKANRRTQALFLCTSCGYSDLADVNAARNISWRGQCQLAKRSVTTKLHDQGLGSLCQGQALRFIGE